MSAKFVWYDLMTSDRKAAIAFYGPVVGWGTQDGPATGAPGLTYTLFKTGEAPVAGVMQLTEEMKSGGAKPTWIGHVAVPDVDAAAAKAVSLGGAVWVPPTNIPGVGRFAMIADPQGAAVNVFQPKAGTPSTPDPPMGAPGYAGWRELLAEDWEKAFDFYSAMFGWAKVEAMDMGPMGIYQLYGPQGGPAIGGMFTKPAEIPAPYWVYYFVVESVQAGLDRVKAAGGQILMGPHQVPGGDWIVQCLDPQGAIFALTSKAA